MVDKIYYYTIKGYQTKMTNIRSTNKQTKNAENSSKISKEKRAIINRLSRIDGQINGVKKMIEEDRDYGDILIQMMAISSSVKSAQRTIYEQYFAEMTQNNTKKLDDKTLAEIFEYLKRI